MMILENVQNLADGIRLLKEDHMNGARVLATHALNILQVVLRNFRDDGATADDLWQNLRAAGYRLTLARPSMSAAITSAVIEALNAIRTAWDRHAELKIQVLKEIALDILDHQIQGRKRSSEQIAQAFLNYLRSHLATKLGHVRILTLSSSSTLAVCLRTAVEALTETTFTISVLESRPGMEGASFGINLRRDLCNVGNLNVEIAPDSHICMFARRTDILLLGADRVSSNGHVSNKMGSLATTLAVKGLSKADVVVISESQKIAHPHATEEDADEENDEGEVSSSWPEEARGTLRALDRRKLRVRNVYFEDVPAKLIEVYITEDGPLDMNAIQRISEDRKQREDALFDATIVEAYKSEA